MASVLNVTVHEGDDDAASYAANTALDEVIGWFVDDGYTDEDVRERVEEALERARDNG